MQIWKPDIKVESLLSFKTVSMLEDLQSLTFEELADEDGGDDGSALVKNYTMRYVATTLSTITCEMYFSDFPFDTQSCRYELSSLGYDAEELSLEADVFDVLTRRISHSFEVTIQPLAETENSKRHSTVGFVIHLKRRPDMYVYKYYMPSFGIVCVSWVNFLIPPDAVPGRVGLLVTLFLVLATLFGNMQVYMYGINTVHSIGAKIKV